jgi:hypothetical protein
MRIGVHLPHIGRKAGPEAIRRAAIQAEELSLASVAAIETAQVDLASDAPRRSRTKLIDYCKTFVAHHEVREFYITVPRPQERADQLRAPAMRRG